jgi:hypothetical protein
VSAIRLDRIPIELYYARGRIYDDKGEYDKAIADCNETIYLNPKLVPAYHMESA